LNIAHVSRLDPNFRLTAIRKEFAQHRQYKPLYEIAVSILPSLGISKNAISYYASLVEHYTVRGVASRNPRNFRDVELSGVTELFSAVIL
jgi:hypothetical protein